MLSTVPARGRAPRTSTVGRSVGSSSSVAAVAAGAGSIAKASAMARHGARGAATAKVDMGWLLGKKREWNGMRVVQETRGGPREPRPQGCGCVRATEAGDVQSTGGNAGGGTERAPTTG